MEEPAMQSFYLNSFDIAVLLTLVLSTAIALVRGFMREVLSICSWIGASFIAIALLPPAANALGQWVNNPMVARGMAGLGLFMTSLIILSIINAIIVHYVKKSEISILDRSLGLVFGIARGAFLVSIAYLLLSLFIPKENPPGWLEEAKTRKLAEMGAHAIVAIAPGYFEDFMQSTKLVSEKLEESGAAEQMRESIKSMDTGTEPTSTTP